MIASATAESLIGFAHSFITRTLIKITDQSTGMDEFDEQHADPEFAAMIRGCMQKDDSSCEKLYKRFYGFAFSISIKYCLNRDDAVEVVNDSFMKVFKNIHRYDIEKPFKPWFSRIVVNTSIDKIRRRSDIHLDIDDIALSGNQHVESDITIKETLKLLHQLPHLHRMVFNLYEIDGYSHKEIATKLGIGESSSRTYLSRAKNQLKDLYNEFFTGKTVQHAQSGPH